MKRLIITHKNCIDGCCSQAILKNNFGDNAEYLELDHVNLDSTKDKNANFYLEKILSFSDSEIYMSDFCLNSELIDKLLQQNNKVIILDHHDTNISYIEPFEKRMANGEKLNLILNFSKDNTSSGAMLTWNYLHPEIEPPLSVKHVSAGDIWKFKLGDSTKHFYTGLLSKFNEPKDIPISVWNFLLSNEDFTQSFVDIGEPIYSQYMTEVKSFIPFSKPLTLNGINGLIVEAPKKYTSDLGNQLALACGGFGLVYNIDQETNIIRCSLRSVAPLIINNIAKKFGGGGHPQASAFRCENMQEFEKLLLNEGNMNIFTKIRNKP